MHLVDDDNILTEAQISSKTTKSDMPSDEKRASFEMVDPAQIKGMTDADDAGKVGETNSSGGGSGSGAGSVSTG